jgi:hypothetical protein
MGSLNVSLAAAPEQRPAYAGLAPWPYEASESPGLASGSAMLGTANETGFVSDDLEHDR